MSVNVGWTPGPADEILDAPGGDKIIRCFPRKMLGDTGPLPVAMMVAPQGPVSIGREVDQMELAGRDPRKPTRENGQ